MKKLIYTFLVIISIVSVASFVSCSKDNNTTAKTVTGTWTGTGDVAGENFGFSMALVQSGTSISGSFLSDDESIYGNFTSASNNTNNHIVLYFTETDNGSTYNFVFTGTVNSASTSISGTYTANGVAIGSWSVTKSKKAARLNINGLFMDKIKNTLYK